MKYKFTKETLLHILKGGLIAGGGAFAIYVLQALGEFDFGMWTEAVVAISAIIINAIKEFIRDH